MRQGGLLPALAGSAAARRHAPAHRHIACYPLPLFFRYAVRLFIRQSYRLRGIKECRPSLYGMAWEGLR